MLAGLRDKETEILAYPHSLLVKKEGFTPLHPESPAVFKTEDEGKIIIRSSGKAPSFRTNVTGFTLVEVLFAVLILGMVIMALFLSLTTGDFSSSVSLAKADLQATVRRVMDWITKDVRQANLIQINTNSPSENHIKFKKVTGIDNTSGSYTLSPVYIEYNYDNVLDELTRNEVDETGSILQSWVFNNITQSPFYVAPGVPLVLGDILTSKKLVIVIAAQKQVRGSLTLNSSLIEEVKIRNE